MPLDVSMEGSSIPWLVAVGLLYVGVSQYRTSS